MNVDDIDGAVPRRFVGVRLLIINQLFFSIQEQDQISYYKKKGPNIDKWIKQILK